MACAAAAVHKKKPQSRLLALLALSWACLQTAQPVRALAGPTVRAALFDPRTPAFWLSRCSSRPSPSTSSSISTGPHRQLRPLRVSPRRAVQAEEPSEQGEGGDDEDQEQAASAQTTDLVEDAPKDEQLQKSEEELAAARRARGSAESVVEELDRVVVALWGRWRQEFQANNSAKADEIETKIDEIAAKREKAKKELEEAKKELKEAEQKYDAKASVQDLGSVGQHLGPGLASTLTCGRAQAAPENYLADAQDSQAIIMDSREGPAFVDYPEMEDMEFGLHPGDMNEKARAQKAKLREKDVLKSRIQAMPTPREDDMTNHLAVES